MKTSKMASLRASELTDAWLDWDVQEASDNGYFLKPWLCTAADGDVVEFDTEDQACAFQRVKRIEAGRDPMTGETI